MEWLELNDNRAFHDELRDLTLKGNTVNLEWCSPSNLIVLGYEESALIVLNVRKNMDGVYLCNEDVKKMYPEISSRFTKQILTDDAENYINSVHDMKGIEGCVVRLSSGQRVKVKTAWYLNLHKAKNTVCCKRALFEAVIDEESDDLKSLWNHDPQRIKMILKIEKIVAEIYNNMVHNVESFYERNKNMGRKEYASICQQEMRNKHKKGKINYFSLAMDRYNHGEISYKSIMKKEWNNLREEMNQ